jgi:hypothetical protein
LRPKFIYLLIDWLIAILGVELRALHLLGKSSTTWVTGPLSFDLFYSLF